MGTKTPQFLKKKSTSNNMIKDKKVLWLTLILIFVGMFLLASVFASGNERERISQTSSTFISKTYENDKSTENSINQKRTTYGSYKNSRQIYSYERERYNYEEMSVDRAYYTQYSTEESRKGFLGDYVKEYSVYVKNRGRTGRYFTVVFDFQDKKGYEFSQAVTQYLRTGKSKKFVYKDIQYERNEILDWDYRIISRDY
jgi:hypothetical protein